MEDLGSTTLSESVVHVDEARPVSAEQASPAEEAAESCLEFEKARPPSPCAMSASGELVVANGASSSWSLLESIIDAENLLTESEHDAKKTCASAGQVVSVGDDGVPDAADDDDDDDDGLSVEEARLEAVTRRLSELEQEPPTKYTQVFMEPEDVVVPEKAAALAKTAAAKEVGAAGLVGGGLLVLLYLAALFFCAAQTRGGADQLVSQLLIDKRPDSQRLEARPLSEPWRHQDDWVGRATPGLVGGANHPASKTARREEDEAPAPSSPVAKVLAQHVRGRNDVLDSFADAAESVDRALASWHKSDQGTNLGKLAASAGLGIAGFFVGVPYVPGITDNLLVGAAAAALPLCRGLQAQNDPTTAKDQDLGL